MPPVAVMGVEDACRARIDIGSLLGPEPHWGEGEAVVGKAASDWGTNCHPFGAYLQDWVKEPQMCVDVSGQDPS